MPEFSKDEVAAHTSKQEGGVWVTYKGLVLDLTDFLHDHPGGESLIQKYAGKDISIIYSSDKYHVHSVTSFAILHSLVIGTLKGYQSDDNQPLQIHNQSLASANYMEGSKFIDLDQPIVPQLLKLKCSKEFYMQQVHRPRHHHKVARIFQSDFLEFFTHTAWWVIPILWGSIAAICSSVSLQVLPLQSFIITMCCGILAWSLIEYIVHRFVFHCESIVPVHPLFFTAHFLTHALHHFLPMEKYAYFDFQGF